MSADPFGLRRPSLPRRALCCHFCTPRDSCSVASLFSLSRLVVCADARLVLSSQSRSRKSLLQRPLLQTSSRRGRSKWHRTL
ncbi:hypothetical protein OAO87_00325 [bacterium]|nr:hypothetical protein [bacterium]